jgi:hypothetical protein
MGSSCYLLGLSGTPSSTFVLTGHIPMRSGRRRLLILRPPMSSSRARAATSSTGGCSLLHCRLARRRLRDRCCCYKPSAVKLHRRTIGASRSTASATRGSKAGRPREQRRLPEDQRRPPWEQRNSRRICTDFFAAMLY